jgi:malate dehydrogenase (quinone)
LFPGAEFTDDPRVIHQWAPLVMPGRSKNEPVAATRFLNGTDVNFGTLTKILVDSFAGPKTEVRINHSVQSIRRQKDGLWAVTVRNRIGHGV